MPQFGDTVKTQAYTGLWKDDPEYNFVASLGKDGVIPKETNIVFSDGGYAIFRDKWQWNAGTYLAFTAAYHSTTHKHSDDLSIWLYHNGDIITEAGPNGYASNEDSTYSRSSFAHNVLIVNNAGLSNQDGKINQTKIIASNLEDPSNPSVTGMTTRFENVQHTRNINYQKKKILYRLTIQ